MNTKIADDFDLDEVRLSQDYTSMVGVKKMILSVPVRKPNKQWFIRVRPGDDWRLRVGLLNFKDENETYLVVPSLYDELSHELTTTLLLTAINQQSLIFLWPVKQPDADGRIDSWNQSAMGVASVGEKEWIRVIPNSSLGGYDVYQATADLNEPAYPELNFKQIVNLAFKGRIIEDLDHPAIRRLKGLV